MSRYSNTIRHHRKRTGATIPHIALQACVSFNRATRLEQGLDTPRGNEAVDVARAAGVPEWRIEQMVWLKDIKEPK